MDRGDVDAGEARDLGERIDQKTRDTILGHREDARVERVGDFGCGRGRSFDGHPTKLAAARGQLPVGMGVGSHTVNREPSPSTLSTVMSPPIIWARLRLIVRPSPVPPCERV